MTITLTREEAQQVIKALGCWDRGIDEEAIHDCVTTIETLRARLSAPCKTGSQCIGGKCPQCVVPEPAGWIYEDDEGRMMFSQMPTGGLFWEPVYRKNKGTK